MYTCIYIYIYTCVCICMCVYVCIYIYIYMYIYIYIYISARQAVKDYKITMRELREDYDGAGAELGRSVK